MSATTPSRAVNQKRLPRPGSLLTPASPPIRCASRRVIDSPSPLPPYLRVVDASACSNALNRRARSCASMPIPVSLTSKRSSTVSSPRSTTATLSVTLPCSVNLTALLR